ncbi:unnamed protein product, partial [Owenia fusiformis]
MDFVKQEGLCNKTENLGEQCGANVSTIDPQMVKQEPVEIKEEVAQGLTCHDLPRYDGRVDSINIVNHSNFKKENLDQFDNQFGNSVFAINSEQSAIQTGNDTKAAHPLTNQKHMENYAGGTYFRCEHCETCFSQ